MNRNQTLLLVSIIAALLGAIADVFILYSPTGGYETGTYEFLKNIDPQLAKIGHYLGILCIPLELIGLWAVYDLMPTHFKKQGIIMACLAIYITIPGVAYHALVSPLTLLIQNNYPIEIRQAYLQFMEPLGIVLFSGLIVMTILLVHIILKSSVFPRYLIFLTPFSFYIYFILLYLLLPVIGNYTAVAGFNLSFACFYCVLFFIARNSL